MNIQCTQKLLEKLRLPADLPVEQNAFFDWHASHLLIDRHNVVLFTNNLCHYSLVLYGMKAADYKKLAACFQQSLTEVLLAEEVDQVTIDKYFEAAGPIHFTKTSNRTITAQMTQLYPDLTYLAEDFEQNQIIQTDFNLMLGLRSQWVGKRYFYPRDLLMAAMAQFKADGQTTFSTEEIMKSKPTGKKAFVLTVELPCGDRSIWRKLVVPGTCTFRKLHRMIQICFNWHNSHLHQFQIMADDGNIVAQSKFYDMDAFDDEDQQRIDCFSETKRLSAFLSRYRSIRYLYDFGDSWLHLIELEETLDSSDKAFAYCLDGEGTAPPEDVGGEGGYLEFLSIVENEADTDEKREMLEWARGMGWRQLNLQSINERLKMVF